MGKRVHFDPLIYKSVKLIFFLFYTSKSKIYSFCIIKEIYLQKYKSFVKRRKFFYT